MVRISGYGVELNWHFREMTSCNADVTQTLFVIDDLYSRRLKDKSIAFTQPFRPYQYHWGLWTALFTWFRPVWAFLNTSEVFDKRPNGNWSSDFWQVTSFMVHDDWYANVCLIYIYKPNKTTSKNPIFQLISVVTFVISTLHLTFGKTAIRFSDV